VRVGQRLEVGTGGQAVQPLLLADRVDPALLQRAIE
jgi:hypothetical protein